MELFVKEFNIKYLLFITYEQQLVPGTRNFARCRLSYRGSLRNRATRIEPRVYTFFPDRLRVSYVAFCWRDGTKSVFSRQRALLSRVDISGRDEQRYHRVRGLFCRAQIPGPRCSFYVLSPLFYPSTSSSFSCPALAFRTTHAL